MTIRQRPCVSTCLRFAVVAAGVVNNYPVLAVPDVQFVLARDVNGWLGASSHWPKAGDVFLTPKQAMLVVSEHSSIVYVDLISGNVVREYVETPLLVKRWSLVLVQFGRPVVLFQRES